MQVTQFDAVTASDDQLAQWLEVLNAMTEADMPNEPRWRLDRFREYLTVTMPGERRIAYTAVDDDGRMAGNANLLLFGGEYDKTGVFEIFMHPDKRGRGVARRMLATIAERAYEEGRDTIGVEVIASTPAVGFYDRLGFSRAVVENRHLLSMTEVDWDRIETSAKKVGAGYRLEYYEGGLPDDLLERYAATKAHMKTDPADVAGSWRGSADAQRLRDSLSTLAQRGMRTHVVVALAGPMDKVVGLTELVVAAQRPTRADQYDTVVALGHRSYGLGMAMKARMLCELRDREPQLNDVQTWTLLDGDPEAFVDTELGFSNDVQWFEYEASVPDLLERLRSN